MSKSNDIWYPIITAHVDHKTATIPPNEKLGTPQMPGIQVTVTTTSASANPIQLLIPAGTAQDLHTALGATLLEMNDARDPEIPIPDDYPGQREAISDDLRIPNDGELVEISLIPREIVSDKTTTLRLTLRSGTILHLRAKEEVRQNLQRDLVHRYQQEAYDLLVHDPTSPLYHHQ